MGFFSKLFGNRSAENANEIKVSTKNAEQKKQAAAPKATDKNENEALKASEQKTSASKVNTPETAQSKATVQENAQKKAAVQKTITNKEEKSKTKQESAKNADKQKASAGSAVTIADENARIDAEFKHASSGGDTSKPARCGKFEIKKAKDGRFVFNLYASNHVIIATSQVYSSSTSALNGVRSVVANATAPIEDQTLKHAEILTYPKWEIYEDKGGQYRFRLYASNGSCICHSQGYTSKANCKSGIESIIKTVPDATIEKIYLKK